MPFLESTGHFLSYETQLYLSSLYIGKRVFEYLMLKTKQSLNLKKTFRIADTFLCSLIKFMHGHKKTCVAAKILENLFFEVPH